MQKNDSNTLKSNSNNEQPASEGIHELFSCEKIQSLADKHRELSMGLFASVTGGASADDIFPLISLLADQAEEISSLLMLKANFENDIA